MKSEFDSGEGSRSQQVPEVVALQVPLLLLRLLVLHVVDVQREPNRLVTVLLRQTRVTNITKRWREKVKEKESKNLRQTRKRWREKVKEKESKTATDKKEVEREKVKEKESKQACHCLRNA